MQDILKTLTAQPQTFLGRIGADPSKLMTVRDWWYEMDEPVETLADPQAAFGEDERKLMRLCEENTIPHRTASNGRAAAFPAWLFLVAIPANP
ncbi:hypothetical protein G6321_00046100 [Bradyrhizobium barranii subsp. barranii]|uniref:Uncharacterized protein n=1 Tax=Bradyrhizobium barranii subsp. barranii TaxID=2823807 RepID=A0A7Z0QAW6_9BRAD|nr:hypothetical protein [Bradyrhizobium barranii]UGX92925.1 hypothetical protein G6321_00046100 [Bradyrhizobium barranii subsp. barranii]